MSGVPPSGEGTMGSCYPDGEYREPFGNSPKRPLYPLDLGPYVRLTDDQHVAAWLVTAGVIGVVIWRLFT